jgi:hypothetical protein
VAGGSIYFGDDFDLDELLDEGLLDAYLFVAKQLLAKWLSKLIKEVEGYDTSRIPSACGFKEMTHITMICLRVKEKEFDFLPMARNYSVRKISLLSVT